MARKFPCPYEKGGSLVSCDTVDVLIEGPDAIAYLSGDDKIYSMITIETARALVRMYSGKADTDV